MTRGVDGIDVMHDLSYYAQVYHEATQIPLSILDLQGGIQAQIGGPCRYCEKFRSLVMDRGDLCSHWHIHGGKQAQQLNEDYIYTCPGGMVLFAVAYMPGGVHQSSVIAGPVLIEYPDIDLIDDILFQFDLPMTHRSALFSTLNSVVLIEPKRIQYLSRMLYLLVNGTSAPSENQTQREENLQARIAQYLHTLGHEQEPENQHELERQLRECIQSGERDGARQALDRLIARMYLLTGMRPELLRAHTIEYLAILSRGAIEAGAIPQGMYYLTDQALKKLMELSDMRQISMLLQDMLDTCIDMLYLPAARPHSPAIAKSVQYIHQRFQTQINLHEVAASVNLSPSYFSALFKDEVGVAFSTYVNQLRVDTAKRLLRGTDASLVEIALSVGFSSQSYFSAVFKHFAAMSPNQYRKRASTQ